MQLDVRELVAQHVHRLRVDLVAGDAHHPAPPLGEAAGGAAITSLEGEPGRVYVGGESLPRAGRGIPVQGGGGGGVG